MNHVKIITIIVAVSSLFLSCTQKASQKRVVNLVVPKIVASSNLTTSSTRYSEAYFRLQVTGTGLSNTVLCKYNIEEKTVEGSSDCEISETADGNFSVNLELEISSSESALLAQAVFLKMSEGASSTAGDDDGTAGVGTANSSDGDDFTLAIYYDSANINLDGGSSELTLSPELKISQSDKVGFYSGRHISADGSGPTGTVQMLGKFGTDPAMNLADINIFAGWSKNLIIHDTYEIEYKIDGESLFDGPRKISTMADYQNDHLGLLVGFEIPGDSKTIFHGFTGAGALASNHKMCVGPALRSLIGIGDEYKCLGVDALITSGPESLTVAEATIFEKLYSTRLMLALDSGLQITDLHGLFGLVIGENQFVEVKSGILEWNYLEGASQLIAGSKVYAVSDVTSNLENYVLPIYLGNEIFDCQSLFSGTAAGYSEVADVPFTATENSKFDASSSTGLTDPHVIICPYDSAGDALGTSVDTLFSKSPYGNGGTGAGGSQSPYMRLEGIFDYSGDGPYYTHSGIATCLPASFRLFKCQDGGCQDSISTPDYTVPVGNNITVTFDTISASFEYYSSATCSPGARMSSAVISGGTSKSDLFVKYKGNLDGKTIDASMIGISIPESAGVDFKQFESSEEYRIYSETGQ